MRPHRLVTLAVALACGCATPSFGQEAAARPGQVVTPPRDTGSGPTSALATIRGRVVDADTGLPLRRATVQLGRPTRGEPRVAITDDWGRYEMAELAAGDYTIYVRKAGYAASYFGQRRFGETPRPLALRAGEVFEKADVSLTKGGVITGRIVDELGEPVLEANVRVMQQRWASGRRRTVQSGWAQTNDLGVYRVFGLPPGDYLVGVSVQAGRMAFAANAATEYAPVYYPGTPDLSQARPVTVTAGQETIADLAVMPAPVVRITGVVLDSTGKPASGGRVTAVPRMGDGSRAFDAQRGGGIRRDGSFEISGVTPGSWLLFSQQGRGRGESAELEMARLEVEVGDQPVEGVTLAMGRGGTIRGRVVFEGPSPPPLTTLRFGTQGLDGDEVDITGGPGSVDEDGTFELSGLAGRRALVWLGASRRGGGTTGAPEGWATRAVLVGGLDVQDTGIDVQPGRVVNARIVLTREFASLSGTVTTDRGAPVTDYSVLVFADDREKWFLPSGRWLKSVPSDRDGQFLVSPLAAGRYLVVAAESFDPNTLGDPEQIEGLRAVATEVTLGDNEKKTVALTLVTP